MSRLTNRLDEGFYVSNAPSTDDLKYKLGKLEDILEEYGIEDLTDLKIALDYYNHRFDGLHTERVGKE